MKLHRASLDPDLRVQGVEMLPNSADLRTREDRAFFFYLDELSPYTGVLNGF